MAEYTTIGISITKERIDRGAAWLDEIVGPSWIWYIDLDKLRMSASYFSTDQADKLLYGVCGCVVAQLVPDTEYHGGFNELVAKAATGNRPRDYDLGFTLNDGWGSWTDLTLLWKEKIEALRTERAKTT